MVRVVAGPGVEPSAGPRGETAPRSGRKPPSRPRGETATGTGRKPPSRPRGETAAGAGGHSTAGSGGAAPAGSRRCSTSGSRVHPAAGSSGQTTSRPRVPVPRPSSVLGHTAPSSCPATVWPKHQVDLFNCYLNPRAGLPRRRSGRCGVPPGGQVAPATAGVEDEQDALQRGAVVDARAATGSLRRRPRRDQGLEQLPQPIIDQPLLSRPRHDQRLDLARRGASRSDTPWVLRPGLSLAFNPAGPG